MCRTAWEGKRAGTVALQGDDDVVSLGKGGTQCLLAWVEELSCSQHAGDKTCKCASCTIQLFLAESHAAQEVHIRKPDTKNDFDLHQMHWNRAPKKPLGVASLPASGVCCKYSSTPAACNAVLSSWWQVAAAGPAQRGAHRRPAALGALRGLAPQPGPLPAQRRPLDYASPAPRGQPKMSVVQK